MYGKNHKRIFLLTVYSCLWHRFCGGNIRDGDLPYIVFDSDDHIRQLWHAYGLVWVLCGHFVLQCAQ